MVRVVDFLGLVGKLVIISVLVYLAPVSAVAKDLTLISSLSAEKVWQRQPVIVAVEVSTQDPFARLDSGEFKQEGMKVVAINQEQIATEQPDHYTLRQEWVVFPLRKGRFDLHLPRIRFRPGRGSIKTLISRVLTIEVKPLPVYVPPTMPVGKIKLSQSWDQGAIVTPRQLLYWNILVNGEDVLFQTMPVLSRYIKSDESLAVLPIISTDEAYKSNKGGMKKTGVVSLRHYTIPLKAKVSGWLKFPLLEVQYFDPVSGTLKTEKLKPPPVFVLNKWMQWLIGLLFLMVLLTGFLMISLKLKRVFKQMAKKRKALQFLEQASNYQQARQAIKQLLISNGIRENLTLTAFVDKWQENKGKRPKLEQAMQALSNNRFSRHNTDNISKIVKQIIKSL